MTPDEVDGRRARGERTKQAIADAAARVLLAGGIAAVSYRAVAAEAGVPLGSASYHYGSHAALVAASVEGLLAGDRDRRRRLVEHGLPTAADAASAAWALLELIVGTARLDEPVQVALLYERIAEATRSSPVSRVVREAQEAIERDAAALVAGTAWAGDEPAALVALVDGRTIGWLARGDLDQGALTGAVARDLEARLPT